MKLPWNFARYGCAKLPAAKNSPPIFRKRGGAQ